MFHLKICVSLFILLMLGSGCGKSKKEFERVAAKGTVTLDGEPLAKGVIRFIPIEGTVGPVTSTEFVDGRFDLPKRVGPVVGKNRIEIDSGDSGPYARDDEQIVTQLQTSKERIRVSRVTVPEIYNKKSTLFEEITAKGPNEFTFELISKKR